MFPRRRPLSDLLCDRTDAGTIIGNIWKASERFPALFDEQLLMHLILDFDGTIMPIDTTDLVLTKLALPAWQQIGDE